MSCNYSTRIVKPFAGALISRSSLLLCWLLITAFQGSAGEPRVFTWGDNSYGQTNVPAWLTDVKSIAAGYNHCLAVRSNGTVVAWGDNSLGQTNGHPSLTNIVAVAGGQYHSLALRSNGTVFAWGFNNYGQLNWPAGLSNVVAIACGANHSMALRSNGTVVAWGFSFNGETNVPPSLTNVTAISAGDAHCLALRRDGTVVAWGDNASGQLNTPPSLTDAMAIAAGYHHNLAIRSNGTVVAWELNVYGETTVPLGLSNVVAVSAGYFHSVALRSNGTVIVWGQDFSGQTNVPAGLNSVKAIAAGFDHDLALSSAPLCPPTFPDLFECRQTLSGSNVSFSVSNLGATREAGEPFHAGLGCSNSLWYTWTAPASGGVVIEATTDFDFPSPILAIYQGSLPTLTSVAYNSAPFDGGGFALNKSRVVFTAVAGQTYQIAVDGDPRDNGQGNLNISLNFVPPPANDAFASAISITGTFYQKTNGTFIGASREAGEPTHNTSHEQTLWWTWTAPTNLNLGTIQVRLTADAVSFPPPILIYTGSLISALSPVSLLSTQSSGMTRIVTFAATAGTTYRIVLAGSQNDTAAVLALTGNYRFRLNAQGLALAITNVTTTSNLNGTLSYAATYRVQNVGSATSEALRLQVYAVPGASMRGVFESPITEGAELHTNISLNPLMPGQQVNGPIAGVAPAPGSVANGEFSALGYGIYAELKEQRGTNWVTVDQALVVFGNWPDFTGQPGPGGGVIRLDPGYIGLSAFNPLVGVGIFGPTNVTEGTQPAYYGKATYASGDQLNFTNTTWLASRFSITNGLFSPGIVTSNTPVVLTAKYSASGFTYDAATNVTVVNLPAPVLKQPRISGTNFIFQLQGVKNRLHVIEAATNLTPPAVWLPLTTNSSGLTGLQTFTNAANSHPRRFYRAREAE